MSKEVSKLKEALNSLSQLSYSASPSKRQSPQLEALQQQTKQLQSQLAVSGLGSGRLARGGAACPTWSLGGRIASCSALGWAGLSSRGPA